MDNADLIETFNQLRLVAQLPSRADTARYLQVAERTVRRWEAGDASVPWSAVLALRARAGHLGMIDPAWHGWILRDGCLWSREMKWSVGIRPGDLFALPYLLQLQECVASPSSRSEAIANAIG